MYFKKLIILLFAVITAFSLGGCFLLPKEAELPELPVVTPYDDSDFRTTSVIRGDMELTKTIKCIYQATIEERYSFPVSGEYYGDIYVDVGDRVSAGTLLAEMDVSEINEQIKNCEISIKTLEIKLDEAQTAYKLALESDAITSSAAYLSSDARLAAVVYLEQSLDIERERLDELQKKKKYRQLYADIDGVVTYVKTVTKGSRTIRGERVVTVTDDTSSVFVANTESYESFPAGMEVDVLSDGVTYRCKVMSPEQLGIETNGRQMGGYARRVFFSILDAETPKSNNAKGEVNLLNESRENVLMVSTSAIFTINGKPKVYVLEEDGTMTVREVSTGLETSRYTEIISGLNEGDCVILS